MAKKKQTKTIQSVPDIYQGLVLAWKERAAKTIVQDTHGQRFLFDNTSSITILRAAWHKVWGGFEAFITSESEATILAMHAEMFGAEPPRGREDKVSVAHVVWSRMLMDIKDRTIEGNPINNRVNPDTGEPVQRRATLGTRKYIPGNKCKVGSYEMSETMPHQAIACYRIFIDELSKTPDGVTEDRFKQAIIERAGELQTRQDPWRIFQYYRARMIAAQLVRLI